MPPLFPGNKLVVPDLDVSDADAAKALQTLEGNPSVWQDILDRADRMSIVHSSAKHRLQIVVAILSQECNSRYFFYRLPVEVQTAISRGRP